MTTYDPDTVVYLEDQLQQLLASLDDLDSEYEAGDLEPADYESLKADYTVRVADTMRHLEEQKVAIDEGRRYTPRYVLAIGAAVLVFAVGAGFLLARAAGERGVNDALTGAIDESSRQRTAECQELGTVQGQLLEALECFDGVLEQDPENVEALTYRAWFLVLAASSNPDIDPDQSQELTASAEVYLDRAVEVDPTYPDARVFRAVVYDRSGDGDAVCAELDELAGLNPPPFFAQQTEAMAQRNDCVG